MRTNYEIRVFQLDNICINKWNLTDCYDNILVRRIKYFRCGSQFFTIRENMYNFDSGVTGKKNGYGTEQAVDP
jgi:hypothetical protein